MHAHALHCLQGIILALGTVGAGTAWLLHSRKRLQRLKQRKSGRRARLRAAVPGCKVSKTHVCGAC